MAFCMVQNPCKTRYFHMCKIVPKYLVFQAVFQHANLNKIKYFTPGKMHRKTYSFTSLILHPCKITWPQECGGIFFLSTTLPPITHSSPQGQLLDQGLPSKHQRQRHDYRGYPGKPMEPALTISKGQPAVPLCNDKL